MPPEGQVEPTNRWGPFGLIFVTAFVLTVATDVIGITLSTFLLTVIAPNLIGNFNLFQLYSLVQSTILFVLNPVIFFLVFYKLGPKIPIHGNSDRFRILKNSFLGGLTGYAVGYLGLTAYEVLVHGSSAFGPNTDWSVWFAQTILILVGEGISIAVLAFTGVSIGRLRLAVPAVSSPMPS